MYVCMVCIYVCIYMNVCTVLKVGLLCGAVVKCVVFTQKSLCMQMYVCGEILKKRNTSGSRVNANLTDENRSHRAKLL